jgi:hypothetical protein
MPGGVAGAQSAMAAPYADWQINPSPAKLFTTHASLIRSVVGELN